MILYLVPIGANAEGTTELGKLERDSKELVVVECPVQRCLLGLAVGSLVVECPVVGVSLVVVGLCWILGSPLVPRVGWGVISIRSSEQVQVSVLVILLAISYFTQKSDQELVSQGSGDRVWLLH